MNNSKINNDVFKLTEENVQLRQMLKDLMIQINKSNLEDSIDTILTNNRLSIINKIIINLISYSILDPDRDQFYPNFHYNQ